MDIVPIREAVEKGEQSKTEIAAIFGVSEGYIRKLIKQHGWNDPKKRTSTKAGTNGKTNQSAFEGQLIDEFAKNKFNLIKKELKDQITPIDEPLLVALANQYSRYVKLEGEVDREGITIISKKGLPYLNPKYNALQGAIKSMATLSKEFGLSIASRKRTGVKVGGDDSERNTMFSFRRGFYSVNDEHMEEYKDLDV